MTTQSLKTSIHDLVNETEDQEILQSIFILLRKMMASEKERIVGYDALGEPISEIEFVNSALEASADVRRGNFHTMGELKAEFGIN